MPEYDKTRFAPPAPCAIVTIGNPAEPKRVAESIMLVDTGADVTVLPRSATEKAGINTTLEKVYEVVGHDGARSVA